MKHEIFETGEVVSEQGDMADLRRCVWLTPMKGSTRSATLASLGSLCRAAECDGDLQVSDVRQLIAGADPALKEKIGDRWTQVASDVRRALRAWGDQPTRWLALWLRCRIPTLADAATAASIRLGPDEAKRATIALEALARSQAGSLDDLSVTMSVIEPLLRAATPETFDVATTKTLENKRTLIRKVVRFVDPITTGMRETKTDNSSPAWVERMKMLEARLDDHEKSTRAIMRRLAAFCTAMEVAPGEITEPVVEAFVARELSTHAPTYVEKLRAAFRRWNESVDDSQPVRRLPLPGPPRYRQEEVKWLSVPSEIRTPLDAYLETAVSARNPGDWGDFVPDDDAEYAELGVAFVDPVPEEGAPAAPILETGTHRNWRDAVKRAWHAACGDPRVQPKPTALSDLFEKPVVSALVAAVRSSRRQRMEAEGHNFDPKVKGSYEHTLVEALCSVGRALEISPEKLDVVEELKRQIDPAVVGMKRAADGGFKRVYAERRIGKRHATMLSAFADAPCLKRWFEGPSVLWSLACAPIHRGRKPQATHVALARSAIIARMAQYVAPVRRSNHARYRFDGDDRHLMLPEGDGEGTLIIPANEGKTLRMIHVRIDPETVRMLKYYIRHFLPIAQKNAKASPDNPHLFPGADGREIEDGGYAPGRGYLTKSKLNTTFKKHMRRYCGLDICLHVMRHLAGKIILDQDPAAMSLVQEILGHKKIATTQSYYAEVSKIVAQRRYIHLVERESRRVLATIKFKFVNPQTGKEITHAAA